MLKRVLLSVVLCIAVIVVEMWDPARAEPDEELDALWDQFDTDADVYTAHLAALHRELVRVEQQERAFQRSAAQRSTFYLVSRRDFR